MLSWLVQLRQTSMLEQNKESDKMFSIEIHNMHQNDTPEISIFSSFSDDLRFNDLNLNLLNHINIE